MTDKTRFWYVGWLLQHNLSWEGYALGCFPAKILTLFVLFRSGASCEPFWSVVSANSAELFADGDDDMSPQSSSIEGGKSVVIALLLLTRNWLVFADNENEFTLGKENCRSSLPSCAYGAAKWHTLQTNERRWWWWWYGPHDELMRRSVHSRYARAQRRGAAWLVNWKRCCSNVQRTGKRLPLKRWWFGKHFAHNLKRFFHLKRARLTSKPSPHTRFKKWPRFLTRLFSSLSFSLIVIWIAYVQRT